MDIVESKRACELRKLREIKYIMAFEKFKNRPDEISNIILEEILAFDGSVKVNNVGTVLQVGDGIARVYGLDEVMSGELLEF